MENFLLSGGHFPGPFLSCFLWNSLARLHHALFDDCGVNVVVACSLLLRIVIRLWCYQVLFRLSIYFHSSCTVGIRLSLCNKLISPHRSHVHQDHLLDLRLWHLLKLTVLNWITHDVLSRVLVQWTDPVQLNLWQVNKVGVRIQVWLGSLTV